MHMKILMVLYGSYPPDSRVRKEIKALSEVGHEMRVLCLSDDNKTETVDGTMVRSFSRKTAGFSVRGIKRPYYTLIKYTNPNLKKELEKEMGEGIDAVHVHDLPPAKTVLRTVDVPVILDLHENYQEAIRCYRSRKDVLEVLTSPRSVANRVFMPIRRYRREQRRSMDLSNHVLAVVPEAKEDYQKSGIDGDKITVVSNTVDLEWFDEHSTGDPSLETDNYLITYVGALSGPHRGLDTAVKALPDIKSEVPDAKIRMAGRGSLRHELMDLANDLGVGDSVEFTGWIDETTFPNYMRAADVGIVPHRSNPHTNTTVPHKLFQYMAAELPVLATDTTAVSRIVRETDAGVIVPAESPEEFAEGAIELADDDTRKKLGKNGREAVEKKYNWSRDGKRLQDVYDNLDV